METFNFKVWQSAVKVGREKGEFTVYDILETIGYHKEFEVRKVLKHWVSCRKVAETQNGYTLVL